MTTSPPLGDAFAAATLALSEVLQRLAEGMQALADALRACPISATPSQDDEWTLGDGE